MSPLILNIPVIAITGSSGKTTTREFIASILEQKWKILRNTGNKNLPKNTKEIAERYNRSIDAIVLELGMGKQGAGKKHCSHIQPNISIITNIGTAHYGNLGNSIESTARFKSALIKNMKQDGLLIINSDDENSKLLDTKKYRGRILTIGTKNKNADYNAYDYKYVKSGMEFSITLDQQQETFFIPTFGLHNIHNALFAVATSHQLGYTASEIRAGLANYQVPIKRLNVIELSNDSLLIDDTVNANPQSVKAAIDVQQELGKGKKKIVVLGSMLELGDYTAKGHKEVGAYLGDKQIDAIFTYGHGAKWIRHGAIHSGYNAAKVKHFRNREELHRKLKTCMEGNSVILVKGSSAMNMDKTVKYIKDQFYYLLKLRNDVDANSIYLSSETLRTLEIKTNKITLHFGKFAKKLGVKINNQLRKGEIIIPQKLSKHITIPELPYEYYFMNDHLYLGPVIGMIVLQRYMNDPRRQLMRVAQYEKIKGLVFLFLQSSLNMKTETISGYYYDPITKSFVLGTFPLPNAIFNRVPLKKSRYRFLRKRLGQTIFNYPYGNTDKLKFWKVMSRQPVIKKHLPKTTEYRSVNSLLKMLQSCKAVYLKPSSMAGGNGIFHVKRIKGGCVCTDIFDHRVEVKSKEALSRILKSNLIKRKKYIVQEEIPTFNKDLNKIDFRIYLQKDYSRKWEFTGIETKVGHKGSIIANSQKREGIIPGEAGLQKFYGLTEKEAKQKIEEMTQVCIQVLIEMEKRGHHLGDACLDLVMDNNRKFWILEAQINYAAEIKAAREDGERRILPYILPTPFEYAKALTGF